MGKTAPIAIGGVGGSGTRIVAAILQEAGFYIGDDLNESLDNLWFTLLFKYRDVKQLDDAQFQRHVSIFKSAMTGARPLTAQEISLIDALAASDRFQHPAPWLQARARRLTAQQPRSAPCAVWGWKEPNTHVVIDRLANAIPDLNYIHVARNGLDMALSQNQNQPRLWGAAERDNDFPISPQTSLKFWCQAHARIMQIGETLGSRFKFVRFEDVCANPAAQIADILSFANIVLDPQRQHDLSRLISPPLSIGRHKAYPRSTFDAADIAFVEEMGFKVG